MKFNAFLIGIAVVALGALGACGGDDPQEAGAPSSVTGIVTAVESEGLNEVTSFTLKDGDDVYAILIDEEIDYGFPLGHLEEHRVGAAPVEVEIEDRDGDLYALSIEDVAE